ncbi:MAG: hypothetical protein DMF62_05500 [Acidobacteria bacterium]|nr:MAG: hypothetical protein DMF62_05500 [Acidobacteriota bacterium]
MNRILILIFFTVSLVIPLLAQPKETIAVRDNFEAEKQLAKLAIDAHGGEKLRKMRTLSVIGTVDVTASAMPQPIPATFVTIFAGDKYRVEINNPFQPLKQAFDGTNTITSVGNGFLLPPFNRVGFPVLQRIGDTGFIVTSIPEIKKGKKGFRVTTPEGYTTDFYLDEKTNQVRSFESVFTVNGRTTKTVAEIDRLKLVEGVSIPEKYVQRFDIGQLTAFANFTAKQILVNTEIANDVFEKVN